MNLDEGLEKVSSRGLSKHDNGLYDNLDNVEYCNYKAYYANHYSNA